MTQTKPRPAAFIDRDGTMIVEHGFLDNPDAVQPIDGAIAAVKLLNSWGFFVIGVTNQSGIARGYFGEDAVRAVNDRVRAVFADSGAVVDAIYYCPHYPISGVPVCSCRKPDRGMITKAESEFAIDLSKSLVIGDRLCDVMLGHTIGVPGVLVETGYGAKELRDWTYQQRPDHVAESLYRAIIWWGERNGLPLRAD